MNIKLIAAACAALCSASAFSATLDPTTQAPQRTFYVGGSSAQKAAMTAVVPDLFDQSAITMITIASSSTQPATAWYGMSKAALTGGTSQRLLVVYNNNNGSAAGVAQILTTGTPEAEADVITVGTTACSAVVSNASTCSSHAPTEVDMAISDVNATELVPGVLPSGAGTITPAQLTIVKTGLQGFGIIVNGKLYTALQNQNIAEGLLPGSCAASSTAACQPSIRRADYASLVNLEGSKKSAADLLNNPSDTTDLFLYRRDDSSGTQASSNIFFGNNVCGTLGFQGALTPAGQFDSNSGVFDISEQTTSGGVNNGVGNNTTTYALGVTGLGTLQSAITAKYVKIDGVSPNFNLDGTVDPVQRNAFASGRYPFAFEMYAMYRNSAPAITKTLATTLINGLKDSTKHNLNGIAYLDGTADVLHGGKASAVNRGGNNCQPLIN
ncbi:MAG: hypothetical protein ACXWJK_01770 [Burkholderiaceae bacterium]